MEKKKKKKNFSFCLPVYVVGGLTVYFDSVYFYML